MQPSGKSGPNPNNFFGPFYIKNSTLSYNEHIQTSFNQSRLVASMMIQLANYH